MKALQYRIFVTTASGQDYTSGLMITPYANMTEEQARQTVLAPLQQGWQPAGLFGLGSVERMAGDHFINAAHIERIAVLWQDTIDWAPGQTAPPAGEEAGGAGIAPDYAESAE